MTQNNHSAPQANGSATDGSQPAQDENQIMAERRHKLAEIRRAHGQAFPNNVNPSHRAEPLHERYKDHSRETLETEHVQVSLAGRIMLKRVQGKASFLTIADATGRFQLYLNDEGVGEDAHQMAKHWDMGDLIEAKGVLFKTMKGELSLRCSSLRLVAKSLRPLPDKFHGLHDTEMRYRQRYLDLMVNA
ncbi:MAG: OB-fold nucleic acid binding domain-containing protein, partial [Burkholderiaceae bacterium]